MFNRVCNRERIEKLMSNVVDSTSRFFDGNYKSQNLVQDVHDSHNTRIQQQYQQEWELNQGVSDIIVKDIELSINWLLPDGVISTLTDLKRRIILYLYLDEIDEEEIATESVNSKMREHILAGVKEKVVYNSQLFQHRVTAKVVSFHAGWKEMIRKLEILLRLEPEQSTYYLIGDFSPHISQKNNNECTTIRGPDQVKLTYSYPFHKRN